MSRHWLKRLAVVSLVLVVPLVILLLMPMLSSASWDRPTVTTNPATLVSQNCAQLNGNVNMTQYQGLHVYASFLWGLYGTNLYPNETPSQQVTSSKPISAPICGLTADTCYCYIAKVVTSMEVNWIPRGNTAWASQQQPEVFLGNPQCFCTPPVGVPTGPGPGPYSSFNAGNQGARVPPPSDMNLMFLLVNPKQVSANQAVTITTNVVNRGGQTGKYDVMLNINGQVEQTKTVSVSPGASRPVEFTVTKAEPGTYTVDIGNKQSSSFTVVGAEGRQGGSMPTGALITFILAGVVLVVGVMVILLRRSA